MVEYKLESCKETYCRAGRVSIINLKPTRPDEEYMSASSKYTSVKLIIRISKPKHLQVQTYESIYMFILVKKWHDATGRPRLQKTPIKKGCVQNPRAGKEITADLLRRSCTRAAPELSARRQIPPVFYPSGDSAPSNMNTHIPGGLKLKGKFRV